mmetsp:Transcript_4717/g.29786  ORF Transcript_4717/g.29786 Transcript_4717/m.29786 type:complete len:243 (-) Transcript_4717:169-897(-)
MSSAFAVLMVSFSMFLPAIMRSSSTSLVMRSALSPLFTPHLSRACTTLLVFLVSNFPFRSSTQIMLSAALTSAVLMASLLSFLFILMDQSLGLGPKITPPPRRRGDRELPRLALPVPFCAKGFFPPPLTSDLVLVDAVPLRVAIRPLGQSTVPRVPFFFFTTMYACPSPSVGGYVSFPGAFSPILASAFFSFPSSSFVCDAPFSHFAVDRRGIDVRVLWRFVHQRWAVGVGCFLGLDLRSFA